MKLKIFMTKYGKKKDHLRSKICCFIVSWKIFQFSSHMMKQRILLSCFIKSKIENFRVIWSRNYFPDKKIFASDLIKKVFSSHSLKRHFYFFDQKIFSSQFIKKHFEPFLFQDWTFVTIVRFKNVLNWHFRINFDQNPSENILKKINTRIK